MKKFIVFSTLCFLIVVAIAPRNLQGQTPTVEGSSQNNTITSPPTNQIIIKFNNNVTEKGLLTMDANQQLPALSAAVGEELNYARPMSGEAHVLKLSGWLPIKEVEQIAADLSALSGVEYAEADRVKTIGTNPTEGILIPNLTPNDVRWNDMWNLRYTASTDEGVNLLPAWDITTGISTTIVAVIDTGILNHADIAGKTVPGYDFISDVSMANDGNGRDNDPSDPGDWVTANECYAGSPTRNSSWHGTHVAGTIGASSNNGLGITGVNWNAKILPLRVLGKCGGMTSDIVDAMRWGAGLPVGGVPNNPNPADVLNLSLGGSGACGVSEQNAINEVVATGATFVIAAGNDNDNAANYSPGNCNNIITVAAVDRGGDRASYSNYGSVIEVSAPGGETAISVNGVLSTLDSGTTTPNNDNVYAFYQGTSMATPHVAGVASLIKGMRPNYTQAQLLSLLQSTARSFPGGSGCNTSNCGAGIIDAYQALSTLNITYTDVVYLPIVVKPEPVIALTNAGFESGATGWSEFSSNSFAIIINSNFPPNVSPHGGSWAAWLGGVPNDISYVQQQVTVPSATPYLTYWHWIASADSCGADFAGVLVNNAIVDQYNLCTSTNSGGWVQYSVNLSAYSGQTITFQVRVETNGANNSNLFVDDVSFQASPVSNLNTLTINEIGNTAVSRQQLQP